MKVALIHYGEIALKGHNRGLFEKRLVENIKLAVGKSVIKKTQRLEGRIVIFLNKHSKATEKLVAEKLSKVFGISWFMFAEVCKTDEKKIKETALKVAKGRIAGKTFRVETSRSFKKFPHNSMQMNELIGDVLIRKYKPKKVVLDNPEVTVHVEITKDDTFVYIDRMKGLGGLPVGTAGNVLVLFSGGIDSAVAAWLMMKRGCNVDYLHIHALRSNNDVRKAKVYEIFTLLKQFDPRSRLYTVPYSEFDVMTQRVPSDYNLILFKRFILMLAENLAKSMNAKAVVTGDSLSQVASQTMDSMTVADESINMSVFRPLLSYDKEEIINLAKKIGTYELSIQPYRDCCSIVSRHPTTKPKLEKVKLFEKRIKIEKVVKKCGKAMKILD